MEKDFYLALGRLKRAIRNKDWEKVANLEREIDRIVGLESSPRRAAPTRHPIGQPRRRRTPHQRKVEYPCPICQGPHLRSQHKSLTGQKVVD